MNASSLPWSQASRILGVDAQNLVAGGVFLTRVLIERLVDDLDEDIETLEFAYRGVDYEIELSARNARALDKLLEPYLEVSRRRGKGPETSRPAAEGPRRSSNAKEVRAWAKNVGIEVSDRGRVPADVVKRYQEAHGH